MLKTDLDPWRVIRSFLAEVDSRAVPDIVDRAGLAVDWTLTEHQDYSHSYRWSAYRPRIDSAYEALQSDDDRLRIAFIVTNDLSKRGLQQKLNEALQKIGWELRGGSLIAIGGSVRELFFPDGSHHDAYIQIRGILKNATGSVDIIDPYIDGSMLTLLAACAKPKMRFRVLTSKHPHDLVLESQKWRRQNNGNELEIRTTKEFHDRFIILDQTECWHIGASIKDAGNRVFMISRIEDEDNREALLKQIQKSWGSGILSEPMG
ncbi:MAG: hypothetical protein WA081_15580 [Desulfosalsimonadaceae bacterium]